MSCAAIDSELDSAANSELAFGLPAARWISAAGVPPGAAACGAADMDWRSLPEEEHAAWKWGGRSETKGWQRAKPAGQ